MIRYRITGGLYHTPASAPAPVTSCSSVMSPLSTSITPFFTSALNLPVSQILSTVDFLSSHRTVLAKLLYCSLAWSGFCSAADRARLSAFLRRCQRLGYCSRETPAITELFDEADETLFGSILANSNHVLQSYLTERSFHSII